MSRLEELPPDQRAALSLLLRQRKSYAEVALLLGIAERSVHDRAHAALAVLAPRQARELAPERRAEVGDYLLGQAGVAERLRTRAYLAGSEQARAWAQAIMGELAPLAGSELPDIPALSAGAPGGAGAAPMGTVGKGQGIDPPPVPVSELAGSGSSASAPSSSRLGGALLLAAIVVAVVVAVILISSGGGSSHKKTTTSAASSTAASKTGPTETKQIALRSPSSTSRTVGVVDVLVEGATRGFYIDAEHLPASRGFFYAIWLYNSHTSAEPLSKAPAVGSTHKLTGRALLPSNAGEFKEILLTRETAGHPTHPGHVVLRGAFSLG